MLTLRIVRYGIAGGLSLLTHLAVLVLMVEIVGLGAVASTTLGFIASVAVSFLLQHHWVFRSQAARRATAPRFVAVTLFGLLLNTSIMAVGYRLFGLHYLLVQAVAFAAVPVSNYLLNRAWTFGSVHADAAHPWSWRDLYLLLPIGALALMAGFSVLHLDLARDLSIARDMARGLGVPLQGPQLAGLVHLGPAWFWMLAWLQLLGLGIPGLVMLVAVLGALKFWLVALIGRKLDAPMIVPLWVAMLSLPAWTLFEFVYVSHPVMAATCMAAVMLFGLRFMRAGRWTDAAALGLGYSLALHAHPSAVALVALPAGFAWFAWRDGLLEPRAVAALALAFAVPFVPWLIHEAGSGFPVLEGLADYGARERGGADAVALAGLFWAVAGGGAMYWVSEMMGWPAALAWSFVGALVALSAFGLGHAVQLARAGDRFVGLLLLAFFSGLGILVLLRGVHPYYMLGGLQLVWAGIVACGLAHSRLASLRRPLVAVVVVVVVVYGVLAVAVLQVMDFQRRGDLPFAAFPLFDVTAEAGEIRPQPFLPVSAAPASGRWLCENGEAAVVHGAYGLSLVHSFGIESRFRCGPTQVRVANGPSDARHVLGLSLAVLEQAGIAPAETVGSFGLIRAVAVEKNTAPLVPAERRYPPVAVSWATPGTTRIMLEESARKIVTTDYGFMMSRPPVIRARCGEAELAPVAADNVTRVFDPAGCGEPVELEIVSAVPELIGVVLVPTARNRLGLVLGGSAEPVDHRADGEHQQSGGDGLQADLHEQDRAGGEGKDRDRPAAGQPEARGAGRAGLPAQARHGADARHVDEHAHQRAHRRQPDERAEHREQ